MIRFMALMAVFSAALYLSTPGIAQEVEMTTTDLRLAEEPDLAFERAFHGIETKTSVMQETWWRDGENWAVDLERGIIEFRNARGWLISAPVQVIGTYNTNDGTFMWGWDHPSVPDHSAAAAEQVRLYGQRHGLEKLTNRVVELTEDEAWELTALADYLTESQGAYRGPAGTTLVYMVFGTVTISGQ